MTTPDTRRLLLTIEVEIPALTGIDPVEVARVFQSQLRAVEGTPPRPALAVEMAAHGLGREARAAYGAACAFLACHEGRAVFTDAEKAAMAAVEASGVRFDGARVAVLAPEPPTEKRP